MNTTCMLNHAVALSGAEERSYSKISGGSCMSKNGVLIRSVKASGRNGQGLVLMTTSLFFLFGVISLSVDLGWDYYLKARVQTAADAAATAAAVWATNHTDTCSTVSCGTPYTCAGVTPPTNSLQAGCLYATSDGPASMTATMLENSTANSSSGVSGNAPTMWVRATVSTSAPVLFFLGASSRFSTIAASATGGISTYPPGACVYVLNPNADGAFSMGGTSSLTGNGCGVYVNSSSSTAISLKGNARISASVITVKGGYSAGSNTFMSTTPTTGVSMTDPLATLAMPTVGSCNALTAGGGGYHTSGGTAVLDPGVYCGGITISGGSVTFNPGTYILNGGGISISGSGSVTGNGITFFNTAQSGYTATAVSVSGSVVLTLSAPTSGTYQGMLFLQDRNVTYGSQNTFNGSSDNTMSGTFYFPTTGVTLAGTSATAIYQAYVVNTLTLSGTTNLQNDTLGTRTGLVVKQTSLIE